MKLETRGRKPLPGGKGKSPVIQTRMTQAQAEKLRRLGGADWIRGKVDKAREVKNGPI